MWCSIMCFSEMAKVLKSLVKDLCSYYFTVKIDHNYSNKMIDLTDRGLGILYTPQSGQFYMMINVFENQWLSVTCSLPTTVLCYY